ncbi:addiction module antidote protein [Helicobacter cetorum]|uniref:Addiction module antidote protein n=1 Tax=Helicobacter cetorum (strain ATCC BAA-540 / CCUG 52418 / MIT 99-5656) TaxID=1163745 RepID=I0ESU4_HELCM|nr:addiction module antidote protein [Helicobacter cetorum]AFI06013.1 addiction module antidote protein [Helicobacter cetorum MIT 99-5656]
MDNLELCDFDSAELFKNREDIVEFLGEITNDFNTHEFLNALESIVRSVGFAKVSQLSGLNRESLYKSLKKHKKPRFETIIAILDALNLGISIVQKNSKVLKPLDRS